MGVRTYSNGESASPSAKCLLLSICLLMVSGCGVFRGIPSHGGGKRFDEEQRVVAVSIRQTLADMDLHELSGKKVSISIESIAQDGGASVTFPGISSINAGISGNSGSGDFFQISPSTGQGAVVSSDNRSKGVGGNAGVTINPMTSYYPTVMSTMPDGAYLKAALEMKARHAGLLIGVPDPEAVLYVLVDVLGTNRSHSDNLIVNTDLLEATCECTYYAQDSKSGKLLFQARRASSMSSYRETHGWGIKSVVIDRNSGRIPPTSMPVNDVVAPATQPAPLARKRIWLDEIIMMLAGADD